MAEIEELTVRHPSTIQTALLQLNLLLDRFRGNRGGGRGGGRNRQPKEEISAEDLDKQLDDYITKMQE